MSRIASFLILFSLLLNPMTGSGGNQIYYDLASFSPVDLEFNNGTGPNGGVTRFLVQPDGKLIVVGSFTVINGTPRKYVARLTPNGSVDHGFNPRSGPDSPVYALARQLDGKILIGGGFTTVNSLPHNHLARLNSDGSLDASFHGAIEGGVTGVYTIVPQPDGKILVGGSFNKNLVRLNSDGSLDLTFLSTGTNSEVSAILPLPDGKILVGGHFDLINGQAQRNLARLNSDGTLDTSFNVDFDAGINCMLLQEDGKLVLAGDFQYINDIARNNMARLNVDSSVDPGFKTGDWNGAILSIAPQVDGSFIVGGHFAWRDSEEYSYLTRLNPDGSVDTDFAIKKVNKGVKTILIQPDGWAILSGWFTQIDGLSKNYLARVFIDKKVDIVEDNLTVDEGTQVDFLGQLFNISETALDIRWDFGNGDIEMGSLNANRTYSDNPVNSINGTGLFTVTLTVTDRTGWTGSDQMQVGVRNVAPSLQVDSLLNNEVGQSLKFAASVTDPGDDVLKVEWNFGDGTDIVSGLAVSHVYHQAGNYVVTVTASDDDGAITAESFNVSVRSLNYLPFVISLKE